VNAAPWNLCAAMLLCVACSDRAIAPDPQPGAGGGGVGGSEGGAGGAPPVCSVPEDDAHPPAFYVVQTCCQEGQVCHENGNPYETECEGGELQLCRGGCSGLLVGQGPFVRETHCHCGQIGFDGEAHHGPGPCAEGSVCCRTTLGMGACTPEGVCGDCRPTKSATPIVSVDCCFTPEGSVPCRGSCDYQQACACGDIDGGCTDGRECCRGIPGSDPPAECVPYGECDHGPCPPDASSSSVVVACCSSFPCRGRCEQGTEGGVFCNCGSDLGWGCAEGEECCVGPSMDPYGDDLHCVPAGQCPAR
jgi:hypothetical protein